MVTPLDLRTQAALGAATFLLAVAVARSRGRLATLALAVISLAATARYLYWRLTATVSVEPTVDAALGALLLAAELHACAMLVLSDVQSIAPLPRRPIPLPRDLSAWPSVDVFIPTYDEPLEVVRPTVLAALAMDWPADRLRVHLLDDGRRDAFRDFAQAAGVSYVVRKGNAHAKAGNLNHALGIATGEFVAIFDCDHVPTRSFLQTTMGWLVRDDRLAAVQTPHHFYSPDPFTRNLGTAGKVPTEDQLFYGSIQRGIDTWNASFFCGSCAVLRRSALDEVGGIAVETVTEDAHTALRLHRRGWRTAYLDVPQAAGLSTETLSAHVGQRIRWARGMAQIFRLDNPLLGRGLSPGQRLSYLAAMLHFFSGVPRLVFLLAPVAYLGFGRHVFNTLPLAALAYGLPHLALATLSSSHRHGRFRHSFWSDVYETCLAWYIAVPTTIALVAPSRGKFNVTAKGGRIEQPFFDFRIALPLLAVAAANVAAIVAAVLRLRAGEGQLDSVAINVAWAALNVVTLAAAIAAACERRQVRAAPRVAASLPAMVRLGDGRTLRCRTVDLGRGGAQVAVPASARVGPGDRVSLSLLGGWDEVPLPAEVVAAEPGALRLRFEPLSLEAESHLVQAVFSRADAWLPGADAPPPDRPLRSLASIVGHGLAGSLRALGVAVTPRWAWSGGRARLGSRLGRAVAMLLAVLAPSPAGALAAAELSPAPGATRAAELAPAPGATLAAAEPAPALAPAAELAPPTERVVSVGPSAARRAASDPALAVPFGARADEELSGARVRLAFADRDVAPVRAVDVRVNGEPVARLDAAPGAVHEVPVPAELLAPRNLLELRLATGADGRCAPVAGGWEAVRAIELVLAARPVPLPDDLALLPLPFVDRGFDTAATVPVVLAGAASPERLRAAALVTGRLALDSPVPLEFDVRVGALPGGRAVVLVAGAEEAARLGLDAPEGPTIRMRDAPRAVGSNAKLLVVAGRDEAELRAAAEALATRATPLVGAVMTVRPAPASQPPPAPAEPGSAPRWVPQGRVVPFAEYPGDAVLGHEGTAATTLSLRFRVAPDLWIWPADAVTLDLGWSERLPAGVEPPRLDVEVNGYFLATLPRPPGPGEHARRIRLRIPREHMRGFNELLVHVRYPEGDPCAAAASPPREPPRVAIDGGSILHLEGLAQYATLPDVALFAHDGYPFTRVADLSETAVLLPHDPTPAELSTTLAVLGRFAQITGRAGERVTLLDASAATPRALEGKDLLVVGAARRAPLLAGWAPRLPLAFDGEDARVQRQDVLDLATLVPLLGGAGPLLDARRAAAALGSEPRGAAILGAESPFAPGRVGIVLTGLGGAELPPFQAFLGYAESRGRSGDLLLAAGDRRWMFQLGPTFGRGALDRWTALRWFLAEHWLALLPVLGVSVFLLASQLRSSLAARMRARLAIGGAP